MSPTAEHLSSSQQETKVLIDHQETIQTSGRAEVMVLALSAPWNHPAVLPPSGQKATITYQVQLHCLFVPDLTLAAHCRISSSSHSAHLPDIGTRPPQHVKTAKGKVEERFSVKRVSLIPGSERERGEGHGRTYETKFLWSPTYCQIPISFNIFLNSSLE